MSHYFVLIADKELSGHFQTIWRHHQITRQKRGILNKEILLVEESLCNPTVLQCQCLKRLAAILYWKGEWKSNEIHIREKSLKQRSAFTCPVHFAGIESLWQWPLRIEPLYLTAAIFNGLWREPTTTFATDSSVWDFLRTQFFCVAVPVRNRIWME